MSGVRRNVNVSLQLRPCRFPGPGRTRSWGWTLLWWSWGLRRSWSRSSPRPSRRRCPASSRWGQFFWWSRHLKFVIFKLKKNGCGAICRRAICRLAICRQSVPLVLYPPDPSCVHLWIAEEALLLRLLPKEGQVGLGLLRRTRQHAGVRWQHDVSSSFGIVLN